MRLCKINIRQIIDIFSKIGYAFMQKLFKYADMHLFFPKYANMHKIMAKYAVMQ